MGGCMAREGPPTWLMPAENVRMDKKVIDEAKKVWSRIIDGQAPVVSLVTEKHASVTPLIFVFDQFFSRLTVVAPEIYFVCGNSIRKQSSFMLLMYSVMIDKLNVEGESIDKLAVSFCEKLFEIGIDLESFVNLCEVSLATIFTCDNRGTAIWRHIYSLLYYSYPVGKKPLPKSSLSDLKKEFMNSRFLLSEEEPLTTGNKDFDARLSWMATLCHTLDTLISSGIMDLRSRNVFNAFVDMVILQFASEEEFMHFSYEGRTAHVNAHESFLRRLLVLQEKFKLETTTAADLVVVGDFLSTFLVSHVQRTVIPMVKEDELRRNAQGGSVLELPPPEEEEEHNRRPSLLATLTRQASNGSLGDMIAKYLAEGGTGEEEEEEVAEEFLEAK